MKKKIKAWVAVKKKSGTFYVVYHRNVSHLISNDYVCLPCTITYEVKKRKK